MRYKKTAAAVSILSATFIAAFIRYWYGRSGRNPTEKELEEARAEAKESARKWILKERVTNESIKRGVLRDAYEYVKGRLPYPRRDE